MLETIAVGVLVAGSAIFLGWSMLRPKKASKDLCSSGCGGCRRCPGADEGARSGGEE